MGVSACGDDYFEPATSHGEDAPNVLLIFTDSTRADYLGHWNPEGKLNDTPNLDALGKDSLSLQARRARGDADRPRAPRPAHRRALVPVPQLRADQGPAARPRLDPDPGPPADRDRGARRGRGRDRLLHRQPLPGRTALRELPAHARLREGELLAGRLPLPQQALQAPGAAQRDRALPAARAERLGGGRPAALDGRLELDLPRQRPRLPDRPRRAQRHQPRRRPEEEAPVLPRRGLLRPARAARRPARVRGRQGRPEGHREGARASSRSSRSRRPTRG